MMDTTWSVVAMPTASRMRNLKTISHCDPEFNSYLDGSFSDDLRALPVRSLNVDTLNEEVTFEIVPVDEIQKPSRLKIIWLLMRPQSLAFSMGPMLATFF